MRISWHLRLAVICLIAVPGLAQQATPEGDARAHQDERDRYLAHVSDLLKADKFKQLDRMADVARSTKARMPGGAWRLHVLYKPLTDLPKGSPDSDWEILLARLHRWTSKKPHSITARVALARAYVNYAWKARGNEFADKVTED